MLYTPTSNAPWNKTRWPNFVASEFACQKGHCNYCGGELFFDENSFDRIQHFRTLLGVPIEVVRGHSCVHHNADVGGAKKSAHLEMAFDIGLPSSYTRADLIHHAMGVGFQHIGFMKYGMHLDMRNPQAAAKFWSYGPTSRELWKNAWEENRINPQDVADIGGT